MQETNETLDIKKLKKSQLIELYNQMYEEYSNKIDEMRFKGIHLIEEPFIPEYLGFTPHRQEKELITTYKKNNCSMWKTLNGWHIIDITGDKKPTNIIVNIKSMYHGIVILEALGTGISIFSYYENR